MACLETSLRARGPYVLGLVAGGSRGGTASFADDTLTTAFDTEAGPALARVWQQRDGRLAVRVDSPDHASALDRLRFLLAVDDDHTPFLRRFARDPLLGDATRRLQGLRPLRTATVAHALLRAVCGQLIAAREAARIESRVVRLSGREHGGLRLPPRREDVAPLAPAALAAHGLVSRKGAALVRICRELDPERLHSVDTQTVVTRLVREDARPMVGRRRVPRGAGALRARPRRRPRPREALHRPDGATGELGGHRGAPRALRRVGRPRERVPPRGRQGRPARARTEPCGSHAGTRPSAAHRRRSRSAPTTRDSSGIPDPRHSCTSGPSSARRT